MPDLSHSFQRDTSEVCELTSLGTLDAGSSPKTFKVSSSTTSSSVLAPAGLFDSSTEID